VDVKKREGDLRYYRVINEAESVDEGFRLAIGELAHTSPINDRLDD
jgi:hypothetical protein